MIENIDRVAILIGKMKHFFNVPAPVGEGRVSPPARGHILHQKIVQIIMLAPSFSDTLHAFPASNYTEEPRT